MFDTFLKDLNEQGGSVRAYEGCAVKAHARITSEPENAAALLLIAYAAQRFVEAYDDQPLTMTAADEELELFTEIVNTLDAAFKDGSEADRLSALNKVSARLAATMKAG